ncbi:Fic family protein [Actinocorallia sp. API 0066]|uniref:Fic family protein n=1 Tax=Actinocorallia sp. API 0066 TaxID=2896846 RepID=UPI001E462F97|nr:Fic family protein [Actinocorallia sp. API 0066]MCD0453788.1 Fic family protein [Actinocorallia sp. API 0066]
MNDSTPHRVIYVAPPLTSEDRAVLAEIHQMRKQLRHVLRTPNRWDGGLRRSALARAIRGSNSIEGYQVAEDDAAAALDDERPISADEQTFLEIEGYRHALGYVLAMREEDFSTFDETEIRAMHYMLLRHDPSKSPGRYRKGPVHVHDDREDRVVYEGPDAEDVPALMEALVASLHDMADIDPLVRSAMAHLNLVMIHPFRDGNGRMARALATSVLTRSDIGEPEFSSIEEWLGANTDDYYASLAITGQGSWRPRNDAHLWISFNLRAHHMQAQTVARRIQEAAETWRELDVLVTRYSLPERTIDAAFEAVLGYRLRRSTYLKRTQVEDQTATRDLAALTSAGLLIPHGNGRGRFYTAGEPLQQIQQNRRSRRTPLTDPYPWMRPKLAEHPRPGTKPA